MLELLHNMVTAGEIKLRAVEELCPALDELLFWAQRWKGQPASAEEPQLVPGPARDSE
jgi:hypothetical protein